MSLASQILINLCISLMITLILFLSLVEHTQPRALCQTVASLIQFFLLSTFFWMVVEAVNLYQMFVKVFRGAYRTRLFMIQSYAFAWGIPMLFTVITAAVKPDNLGPATESDSKICVLRGISFYCGLLLPVCVVMLTNFVLLILVLKGINAKSKASKSMEIQKKARIAFGCTLLLGTTWVFAVLAVGDLRDVFQWLFCIFNSLQGFFIFIFYAVRNKEVRNHWRLFLGKENGRRSSNQYTSRNRTQRTTSSHSRSDSGSSHGTRQF
ncbi:adhesion G-protein coupled receptor G2-like [Hydra vulgaris]|uniref:Adhesion G-protein coupled receptor G2-like n=1 Tax=Hydra vulgaris TaxID=6087 RepID=A0ABM4C7N1_HYDVU